MADCFSVSGLISLAEAKRQLLDKISIIQDTQTVTLDAALHRVNAATIISPINVPAYNNSAMDGYAFNAALHDSHTIPAATSFNLVGTSMAGAPFHGELAPGQCIRIMTGAVVPDSANTVEMQENISRIDSHVVLEQPLKLGKNIRCAGEDIAQGKTVFMSGQQFKPADIGLLSSLGVAEVQVKRKPKIAVFSTGDELKLPGQPLKAGNIYESNRYVIIAMLQNMGVDIIDLGIIPDDYNQIKAAFLEADQLADIVISSGGVSVGDADYTKEVLDEIGQIDFWKVAIKPGKPFAFGHLPNSLFFGLPGNPVSATVTLHLLGVPGIKKLMGTSYNDPLLLPAYCTDTVKKRPGRMDFQRGLASLNAKGELIVTPLSHQGSGVLSSLSQANCYLVLEESHAGCAAGDTVHVQLFDSILSH